MPALSRSSIQNSLLLAIRARALGKLLPHLEVVPLTLKDTLESPGDQLRHAYFPQAGMISITVPLDDGRPVEVGTIGKEGMLGTSLLLGGQTALNTAMVQIEGWRCASRSTSCANNLMVTTAFVSSLADMRRAFTSKSPRLRPAMGVTASINAAPAGLPSPDTGSAPTIFH